MKKSLHLTLLLIFIGALGCKSLKDFDYNQGQKELGYFNYALAIDSFLKSWEKEADPATARALAESYLKIRDFEQAEAWYAKLEREEMLTAEDFLGYAEVLIANSNYLEARKILSRQESVEMDSVDVAKLEILQASSQLGKELINSHISSQVTPLCINSPFSEFGAFFSTDSTILFVNDELIKEQEETGRKSESPPQKYGWTGNGFLKVYQVGWNQARLDVEDEKKELIKFKADLHIGPVHISDYFTFFTVTQDQPYNPEKIQLKGKDYTIHPEIFYLVNSDSASFDDAKPLPFNSTFEYSVSDPFYDPVMNRLYFSSNMPGGYGGADLYYTYYLDEDKWIAPINLGSEHNTEADERSPFIGPDGGIYFSSNGLGGIGGLDIFYSEKKNGKFAKPENMGSPINSNRDDFFFYLHPSQSKLAVFSSDRSGGKGGDDLYLAELEFDTNFVISGKVIDQISKQPISDAVIRLVSDDQSLSRTFISEADGSYSFKLNVNQKVMLLSKRFGYFDDASEAINLPDVSLTKDSIIVKDILLDRIEVGGIYRLENIYYEYAQWDLSLEAKSELDKVVRLLDHNPTLKIELVSHTDSRGDAEYNRSLSGRRADAAVTYILSKGISASRIKGKGMGEEQLVNHCADGIDCFEPEHEENRRTEFLIVDF